jgi:predicted permease
MQFPLISGSSWGSSFTIAGHSSEGGAESQASMLTVNETFFTTLNIPMLLGHELRGSDIVTAPGAVVVNETFARKFLPGENAVGQVLKRNNTDWQIVGVCRDAKYADIKAEVPPTAYLSFRQNPIGSAYFALRTTLPPLAMAATLRKYIVGIDSNVPLTDLSTQEQVRDKTISQELVFAKLCSSLAVLALLLSCIGLYGLMAYQVAGRTGEIGIRIALGATRGKIAEPILREAVLLAGLGVLIGTPLTLALTRLIRSHLYGVGPSDPITFCIAVLVFLVVGLLAAWMPARRASRVDPMVALRNE